MDTCLHLRTCACRSGDERSRAAARIADRREAGCRVPRQMRPRVSIASVPKWSWSVICVGAGPSRITLLFPSCFTPPASLSHPLFLSLFLCVFFSLLPSLRTSLSPASLSLVKSDRFCLPPVSYHFISRRARGPFEIGIRAPGLSPRYSRYTHIHTHGNTQCHSVELLPVGKAKISLQAAVPPGDRPPPPPTPPPTPDSPASAGKCTRFLREGNQRGLFETVSTRA